MHCGNCKIIDYCAEPYNEICICCDTRFKNTTEKEFIECAESSNRISKKAIINDVYKKLKNRTTSKK